MLAQLGDRRQNRLASMPPSERPDLNDIALFARVVETKSFTAAAASLVKHFRELLLSEWPRLIHRHTAPEAP